MKLFVFFLILFVFGNQTFAQQKKSPKLIVGIVVDQMCYEYLYRYYDKFGDDGFKKIMKKLLIPKIFRLRHRKVMFQLFISGQKR